MRKSKTLMLITLLLIAGTILYYMEVSATQSAKSNENTALIEDSDFYNIYTKILGPSCGMATCHDGSFEPNYSSMSAAYYTMVWHPLLKNNSGASFKYRVVPHDVANSLFYERITNCCFVDQNDRMPFYDPDGLSENEKQLIAKWISEGAKDIFGNIPNPPQKKLAVGNFEISFIDKNKNTHPSSDFIVNDLNENVTHHIPENAETVVATIQINAELEISSLLSLSLYSDADYTNKITDITLVEPLVDDRFRFKIQKNDLKGNEQVFLKINIAQTDSTSLLFSYPNAQIYSMLRYVWSFYWKKES